MILLDILLALVFCLLVDLLGDWLTKLSEGLVKTAVRRLPRKNRAEWEEDWLADLKDRPRLIRPFYALGLFRAAKTIRGDYCKALRARRPVATRLSRGAITIKRLFDLTIASTALVFVAPLMTVLALWVKFSSPGPVLFRQRRYGPNGAELYVYKFRSMTVCEHGPMVRQATSADGRITSIGKLLRRTSLDELPQLINVIQGALSLVGPRPHAVAHNEEYRKLFAGRANQRGMLPGITGLAQIHGLRDETVTQEDMRVRVEHDLDYLKKWSLWLDIKILIKTVVTIFRGF
jgi:lipopolysaccharide/colanic/teichoic acid biosynthesis glycosyltransferase